MVNSQRKVLYFRMYLTWSKLTANEKPTMVIFVPKSTFGGEERGKGKALAEIYDFVCILVKSKKLINLHSKINVNSLNNLNFNSVSIPDTQPTREAQGKTEDEERRCACLTARIKKHPCCWYGAYT